MSPSNLEDVLVIGGGAAGLNAALILARARRQVLVVDSGAPRNSPAQAVHGFVSRDGTPPRELLSLGREEVEQYGGRIIAGEARAIRPAAEGFEVELTDRTVRTRRVIVATGLRDELPDLPELWQRWARDVLHCPYCHGWEVRDQSLGVLGWQPDAVHQALLVRQWSNDVVFFAEILDEADRAKLTARGVRIVNGHISGLVVVNDELKGVRLTDGTAVDLSALFVPTRAVPNDALLTGLGCEKDGDGWVRVDPNGLTSAPGVWAVGNVVDFRAQVVTSAGAGAKTAVAVNMDLIEQQLLEQAR